MKSLSEQTSSAVGPRGWDVLLFEKYWKLTRQHVDALPVLLEKLTGLNSGVAWAPQWPHQWKAQDLPIRSRLCRRVAVGDASAAARCRCCGARHLRLTLQSGHQGHYFICPWGVRNFWFPLIVRRCPVGIAFVQALDRVVGDSGTERKGPSVSAASSGRAQAFRRRWAGVKQANRAKFRQAARLLQLTFEHAQTAVLADLRKEDLTKAQQAVLELQTVAARLREDLNGLLPAFCRASPVPQPKNHTQGLVQAMIERIQRDYARPMTLQQCARDLNLNTAYLSTLFSRSAGLPFKTFLTEVRMEKAREMLSTPGSSISDVACAVGYASENRFRIAFKSATGLSPKVWRETLKMEPPSPAGGPA